MKKNHKGFTLAEVLITLGIIGVVAAMTIPTLVKNYQNTVNISKLKKEYSQLVQVLKSITNDYNCDGDLKCTGLFYTTNASVFGDELTKYYKVLKNCKLALNQGCNTTKINSNYNGTGTDSNLDNANNGQYYYRFISENGTAFFIYAYGFGDVGGCDFNRGIGSNKHTNQACGEIYIDVNGPKNGPNYRGRDIFTFLITRQGPLLYPYGGKDSIYRWKDTSGTLQYCHEGNPTGASCTGRIMEENWTINY